MVVSDADVEGPGDVDEVGPGVGSGPVPSQPTQMANIPSIQFKFQFIKEFCQRNLDY